MFFTKLAVSTYLSAVDNSWNWFLIFPVSSAQWTCIPRFVVLYFARHYVRLHGASLYF